MKRTTFFSLIIAAIIISASFTAITAQVQTSAAPAQESPYFIGPGDEIEWKVLGEEAAGFKATIDEEGMVQVPFVDNRLNARCRTEKDVRGDVAKMMSRYFRNPIVSLRV